MAFCERFDLIATECVNREDARGAWSRLFGTDDESRLAATWALLDNMITGSSQQSGCESRLFGL